MSRLTRIQASVLIGNLECADRPMPWPQDPGLARQLRLIRHLATLVGFCMESELSRWLRRFRVESADGIRDTELARRVIASLRILHRERSGLPSTGQSGRRPAAR